MGNRKKRSLKNKLAVSMIVFALILGLALGVLVCYNIFDTRMSAYETEAFEYTRTAAGIIDGDKIAGYLETGEKDDHYYYVLDYLNSAQRETCIKYFYIFVPLEDEIVYIWDADNADDVDDPDGYELGHREAYGSEEDRQAVLNVMCDDPPEKEVLTTDDNYGYVASAYTPIYNSDGEVAAISAVDLSIPNMLETLIRFMKIIVGAVLAITVLCVALLYKNLSRRVIKPIVTLTKSAGETIENLEKNESSRIDIKTGDEIEDLADAFTKMDVDLKEYIKELSEATTERERVKAELNVSAHIQADMLPREFPAFPDRKEFDLFAFMHPAKEVGGDFYDFFMVDDDHIALVMADVSGKGIPGALFMVVSKIFIKNAIQAGMHPAEALERVNEQLLENNNTGLFVTVWLAVIDLRTGRGYAANAGHEHPALKRSGGEFELIKYKHSPAVSTMDGMVYKEHDFKLDPGDVLFVYTDGVTDAINENDEFFGVDRMVESLNRHRDKDVNALCHGVADDIVEFVGEAPQFDDVTMLAFEYKGTEE